MAKIMKYKITERKRIEVEVFSEDEENLVIALNRDMNRFTRKEKRQRKINVSIEDLQRLYKYEFASNEPSIIDVLIKEETELMIDKAVNSLPPRQRFVIKEHFWKNKSLRQIAKENNLHLSSVAEAYHSAMSKLGVLLKNIYDF